MWKLWSPKLRAGRVWNLWFASLTRGTHTQSETRRHFPVQFSLLNVMCYCVLFNLCFTTHRMHNGAGLILWLESSCLEWFCTSGLFFLFNLDLVTTFTFLSLSHAEEFNAWIYVGVPTPGPAGCNSPLQFPRTAVPNGISWMSLWLCSVPLCSLSFAWWWGAASLYSLEASQT